MLVESGMLTWGHVHTSTMSFGGSKSETSAGKEMARCTGEFEGGVDESQRLGPEGHLVAHVQAGVLTPPGTLP